MMSTSITLPEWRINAPPIDACLVYNQQHSWTQRKPPTPKHTHTRPCYAKKVCSNKRSVDSPTAIFTWPVIPKPSSTQYSFPISSDNVPTCTRPAADNIFFNQNAIVGFILASRRWYISGLVRLLLALIPSFLPEPMKRRELDTQAINYLLGLSPKPKARKPPDIPTALNTKNTKLRGGKKLSGWKAPVHVFSCFVISYNASLPWVALWVVARPVTITYFTQLRKN